MKTILITGTTSGIGRETALRLAEQGHTIVMANRSAEKSAAVKKEIIDATGNQNISTLPLDLASLDSVHACASAFLADHDKLDILINNAGLMAHQQEITDDGFELQFQANNLSQLLLTVKLLPALEAAAPAHIIFVTSMVHKMGKINFDSFKGWKKYSANGAYGQSKLAMMLNARELAERLKDKNIAVNTLHPGAVGTGIQEGYPALMKMLMKPFNTTPEKGALTTLHLAGLEADQRPTGKYFVSCKEAKANKVVEDARLREKVWNRCCQHLGISNKI